MSVAKWKCRVLRATAMLARWPVNVSWLTAPTTYYPLSFSLDLSFCLTPYQQTNNPTTPFLAWTFSCMQAHHVDVSSHVSACGSLFIHVWVPSLWGEKSYSSPFFLLFFLFPFPSCTVFFVAARRKISGERCSNDSSLKKFFFLFHFNSFLFLFAPAFSGFLFNKN